MKKYFVISLAVLLSVLLASCGGFVNGSEQASGTNAASSKSDDQIQRALVCYNGCIYGYDFYDYLKDGEIHTDTLPEGFEYSGSTEGEDPDRIPTEELTTAQMSDGCEIYASTAILTVIYVKYPGESEYRQFIDVTEWVSEQKK